jgi:hypothetical protein
LTFWEHLINANELAAFSAKVRHSRHLKPQQTGDLAKILDSKEKTSLAKPENCGQPLIWI